MPADDQLSEKADALAKSVQVLLTSVTQLRESNVRLVQRGHRNRVMIVLTILGLTLDLVLSGVLYAQHLSQVRTNRTVACNTELRTKLSNLAESDRANMSDLVIGLGTGRIVTDAQFHTAFVKFQRTADRNTAARTVLTDHPCT